MALANVTDIGPHKPLTPVGEALRINAARANRRLFSGDLAELRLEAIDDETPLLQFNWFRRAATFFPEFMLAERPEVSIEGNPRMTEAFERVSRGLFENLQYANVLMISEGESVMASHPSDPLRFVCYPTDSHYVVTDRQGRVTFDLLTDVRQRGNDQTIDIVGYSTSGRGSFWRHYEYNAGVPGNRITTFSLPPRAVGRQVVQLQNNASSTSVYDDIKQLIGLMARSASNVMRREKRNSNPHLAGPEGMLAKDENGNAYIDERGMFLRLQEGDPQPMYLYLDTPEQSAKWLYDTARDNMLNLAALPPALFDPEMQLGDISGRALERVLLAFRTRVSHYARVNEKAIEDLIRIWRDNFGVAGGEIFQYDESDVEVEWHYNEVFEDGQAADTGTDSGAV